MSQFPNLDHDHAVMKKKWKKEKEKEKENGKPEKEKEKKKKIFPSSKGTEGATRSISLSDFRSVTATTRGR